MGACLGEHEQKTSVDPISAMRRHAFMGESLSASFLCHQTLPLHSLPPRRALHVRHQIRHVLRLQRRLKPLRHQRPVRAHQ